MIPVDPTTVIATISQSIAVVKTIQDLLKKEKPDVLGLREQIQELRERLLDTKDQMQNLQEVNMQLRSQLADLTRNEDCKPSFEHGAYWFSDETTTGPFCTCCWDAEKKKIRLVRLGEMRESRFLRMNCKCPQCKSTLNIDPKWLP